MSKKRLGGERGFQRKCILLAVNLSQFRTIASNSRTVARDGIAIKTLGEGKEMSPMLSFYFDQLINDNRKLLNTSGCKNNA